MEIGMPDGALKNRGADYLEARSNEVVVTVLIAPIRPLSKVRPNAGRRGELEMSKSE